MEKLFEHIENGEVAQFHQAINEEVNNRVALRLQEIKRVVAADLFGLEIDDEIDDEIDGENE